MKAAHSARHLATLQLLSFVCGASVADQPMRKHLPGGFDLNHHQPPSPSPSPRPERKRAFAPAGPQCNNSGVLLLSYGRSATDSFAHTIRASSNLKYCNDLKEAFKRQSYRGTPQNLRECIAQNPRGTLVHVKPEHIMKVQFNGRCFAGDGCDLPSSPDAFFEAARRAGFRLVLTTFRDNQLARQLSSYEQSASMEKHGRPPTLSRRQRRLAPSNSSYFAKFFPEDLIGFFEFRVDIFNRNVEAADAAGMKRLYIPFQTVTRDLCASTNLSVEAFNQLYAEQTAGTHCTKSRIDCKIKLGHMKKSHRDASLSERLGSEEVAERIVQALKGTDYEWMLNTSLSSWPPGTPRRKTPIQTSSADFEHLRAAPT
jgi:hypothetical protein